MAARELVAGDVFLWNDRLYTVKKIKIIKGKVKVFAKEGWLTLKPDEWLYML